jgi:hypothetical protein
MDGINLKKLWYSWEKYGIMLLYIINMGILSMIKSDSIICRNDNIPTIELDGDVAMMNIEKGKYYGLNSVASRVWELLEESQIFSELIELLLKEYDVDKTTCVQDVSELLDSLNEAGLITISEGVKP